MAKFILCNSNAEIAWLALMDHLNCYQYVASEVCTLRYKQSLSSTMLHYVMDG